MFTERPGLRSSARGGRIESEWDQEEDQDEGREREEEDLGEFR